MRSQYYVKLSRYLAGDGQRSEAKEVLRECIEQDPESFHCHFELGVMTLSDNELDVAKEELEQALQLKPDDTFAAGILARCYNAMGDQRKAVDLLRESTKFSLKAFDSLMMAFDAVGSPGDALRVAETICFFEPENHDALYEAARFSLELGDRSRYIELLRKVVEMRAGDLNTALLLMRELLQDGDFELAREVANALKRTINSDELDQSNEFSDVWRILGED